MADGTEGADGGLARAGDRVTVRTIRVEDGPAYRRAIEGSRERVAQWNPVDPDDFSRHLAGQGPAHRTFLIVANVVEEGQPFVGRVNVSNVVHGRWRNAGMGYDAYDPYAGRGLFREGLRLVVDVALAPVIEGGLGLHRIEANVQPGNTASAGTLRSLGFQREGHSPRFLFLPDAAGDERWRDHERYAITAEDWPAEPYAPARPQPVVVLADTHGDPVEEGLARAVAIELGVPLIPVDVAPLDRVIALARGSVTGAIISGDLSDAFLDAALLELQGTFRGATVWDASGYADPESRRTAARLALEFRASR